MIKRILQWGEMHPIRIKLIVMLIIFIIPFGLIFILTILINIGTWIMPVSLGDGSEKIQGFKLIIDLNKDLGVGDYIYYYATILGIIVTGILSYEIWKTSVKSNKLASEIKLKEDNREREIVKENALIVYCELLFGLSDLKKLYLSMKIHNSFPNPKKMLIREDFIKNVAILKNELSQKDIEEIYYLYGHLLTIKTLLEDYTKPEHQQDIHADTKDILKQNLIEEIVSLTNKVLKNSLIDYLQFDISKDISDLLSLYYFELICKIKCLTGKNVLSTNDNEYIWDTKIKYIGNIDENNKFNDDNGILYYGDNDKFRLQGKFEAGKFISGKEQVYQGDKMLFEFEYDSSKIIAGKLYKKDNHAIKLFEEHKKEYKAYEEVIKNDLYFDITKFDENGEAKDGYIEKYNGAYIKGINRYGYFEKWENDNKIYFGQIKNGKYKGKGFKREVDTNGDEDIRIGEFEDGKLFDGKRIKLSCKNKSDNYEVKMIYTVVKNQYKMRKWINNQIYPTIAYFVEDRTLGKGREFYQDCTIKYKGQMKRYGVMEGKGTEYYYNGNVKYAGEWAEGKYNGNGKLYAENKALIFDGEFKKGKIYNGYKSKYLVQYDTGVEDTIYGLMNTYMSQAGIKFQKFTIVYEGNICSGKAQGQGKIYIEDDCIDIFCKDGILDKERFNDVIPKIRPYIELTKTANT